MLEKQTETDEEEEAHIKKLIKVRNPKEYHGIGLARQELLYGKIEEEKKNPKITFGKSYVISISPSQRNYEVHKKKKFNFPTTNILQKKKEEFKIEEQYENRAILFRVKYK